MARHLDLRVGREGRGVGVRYGSNVGRARAAVRNVLQLTVDGRE